MICSPDGSAWGYSDQTVLGAFLLFSLQEKWSGYRKKLQHCRKEASEEMVHEFRIETRRMLSIVSLLEGIVPRKHLRDVDHALRRSLKSLSHLRDIQTQLCYLEKLQRKSPEARTYYKTLEERDRHLARRIRGKLPGSKSKGLPRSVALVKRQLRCAIVERRKLDLVELVRKQVRGAYAETVKRYHDISPANAETLHRTRVAFKRFRYMMEALQPVLPGPTERLLTAMHRCQTRMGDIQDLEVLLAGMDKFLKKHDLAGKAWDRLRRTLVARRAALLKRFLDSGNDLFEFDPRPYLRPGQK